MVCRKNMKGAAKTDLQKKAMKTKAVAVQKKRSKLTSDDIAIIKDFVAKKGSTLGWKRLLKARPEKTRRTRKTVGLALKQLKQNGIVARKAGSGRKRTMRTEENIAKVKELIEKGQTSEFASLQTIARSTGLKRCTVHKIARADLGLRSYRQRKCHRLSAKMKQGRLDACKSVMKAFGKKRGAYPIGGISPATKKSFATGRLQVRSKT